MQWGYCSLFLLGRTLKQCQIGMREMVVKLTRWELNWLINGMTMVKLRLERNYLTKSSMSFHKFNNIKAKAFEDIFFYAKFLLDRRLMDIDSFRFKVNLKVSMPIEGSYQPQRNRILCSAWKIQKSWKSWMSSPSSSAPSSDGPSDWFSFTEAF